MVRSRVLARGLALLAVVALIGVASAPAGSSPEAMKALQILEPRERMTPPEFAFPTLGGKPLSIKALKGKVVLVNFWATWCVPCQWEMPLMEKLYQGYKAKAFMVAAISLDQQGAAVVEPFVKERKLTYPVLLDPQLRGARQFGVRGLPATFLVGADGYVRGVTYGPREWDGPDARALIEALLKDSRG
jgi:thiol-disulfide isomerase/thioredoxin